VAGVRDHRTDADKHTGPQSLADAVEQPREWLQPVHGHGRRRSVGKHCSNDGCVTRRGQSHLRVTEIFSIIKWVGVAYLILMGVTQFRKRLDSAVAVLSRVRTLRSLYWQGFITSAANPKAVMFFAALLPQFVNPAARTGGQFIILGVTYLVIDTCFLTTYGGFAGWMESRFQHHVGRHMNQISGALLVVAAILLGLKEIETN